MSATAKEAGEIAYCFALTIKLQLTLTVLASSTADSISDIIIGIGSPPQSHHQEEQELQSLHLANGVAGLLAVELMDRKEEGHHTEK
jgi:hypothetical protein